MTLNNFKNIMTLIKKKSKKSWDERTTSLINCPDSKTTLKTLLIKVK